MRIDYNLNSEQVAGRFVKDTSDRLLGPPGHCNTNNPPDCPTTFLFPRYSWSVTATGSFNPTTILETTVGVSHNSIDIRRAAISSTAPDLG